MKWEGKGRFLTRSAGLAIAAPIIPDVIPAPNFAPNPSGFTKGKILHQVFFAKSYPPIRIALSQYKQVISSVQHASNEIALSIRELRKGLLPILERGFGE